MRMEVVTHKRMISLGILAKDLFAKGVLTIDADGKSFDVLQTVQEDTLEKIKLLPLEGGFDQRIKDGAIDAFEQMKVGDKFLCLNDGITQKMGISDSNLDGFINDLMELRDLRDLHRKS